MADILSEVRGLQGVLDGGALRGGELAEVEAVFVGVLVAGLAASLVAWPAHEALWFGRVCRWCLCVAWGEGSGGVGLGARGSCQGHMTSVARLGPRSSADCAGESRRGRVLNQGLETAVSLRSNLPSLGFPLCMTIANRFDLASSSIKSLAKALLHVLQVVSTYRKRYTYITGQEILVCLQSSNVNGFLIGVRDSAACKGRTGHGDSIAERV